MQPSDRTAFLAAVGRSRTLHRPWCAPPATPTAFDEWIVRSSTPRCCTFLLRLAGTGELVGVVNANEIVRGSFQSAYLGYYAFVPFAGRGLMTVGLTMAIDQLLGRNGLHRLEANIQPKNEASRRLAERLGFRLEGFSPRYLKIAGRWRDHERWAILAEEWRARLTLAPGGDPAKMRHRATVRTRSMGPSRPTAPARRTRRAPVAARPSPSLLVLVSLALLADGGGGALGDDGTPPGAAATEAPAPDFPALGREVVSIVHDNFVDADRARQWASLNGAYAADIADPETFARETRRVLSLLGTSHTAYYTADDPEHAPLEDLFGAVLGKPPVRVESIGADIRADGTVRVVFRGGPADIAGLRRGDRILAAGDMERFHPVRSLRGHAGERVRLTVVREPASPPFDVVVVPRLIQPRREWVEASERGAALHEADGKTVATLPLYACAGEDATAVVQAAIAGPFRDADALVLDLREGWGGCNPDLLDVFSTLPPRLEQRFRDGDPVVVDDQWRKPVVVLVNERTRSGKEVVARTIQRKGIGVVVGERTAGAVLGGRVFPLADGSLLFLAVADITVDGERLEGLGVEPDVTVADELAGAAGRDVQLQRAIEVAAELAR